MSDTSQNSSEAAANSTIESEGGDSGRKSTRLDPGFKRNIKILVGVFSVLLIIIVVIFIRSSNAMKKSAEGGLNPTAIGIGTSGKGQPLGEMTPAEIERLNRVNQKDSDVAKTQGNTYIPKDMPLNGTGSGTGFGTDAHPPTPNDRGPGGGYNVQTGQAAGGAAPSAADTRRDQMLTQGLDRQLGRIIANFEAPQTGQAAPYELRPDQKAAATTASAPGVSASSAVTVASNVQIFPALSIFGAQLTSPLDTEKTDYVSARLTSGPASGALVFGSGQVVGKEGVRLNFTMMSFGGKSYPIKAVALDVQTSSNAMAADVDRHLLTRYVIPIVGSFGQAYANATANPGQQVVSGSSNSIVATPAVTARQAMAAGVAGAIGKIAEAATYTGPNTAYMPVNTAIGLLFSESVKKATAP